MDISKRERGRGRKKTVEGKGDYTVNRTGHPNYKYEGAQGIEACALQAFQVARVKGEGEGKGERGRGRGRGLHAK